MDHDTLYETDICTWAEQQAAALRSLLSRADLPNQLDFMNIVEEIEDVGSSHLNAVSSFIRLILLHPILISSDQDAVSVPHWKAEAAIFHAELLQRYQPSMRQRVQQFSFWRGRLPFPPVSWQAKACHPRPYLVRAPKFVGGGPSPAMTQGADRRRTS
jgi:hypothetical protein